MNPLNHGQLNYFRLMHVCQPRKNVTVFICSKKRRHQRSRSITEFMQRQGMVQRCASNNIFNLIFRFKAQKGWQHLGYDILLCRQFELCEDMKYCF